MPRCICIYGKMWDEQARRCVLPSECVYKGRKRAWTEIDDDSATMENNSNNSNKATQPSVLGKYSGFKVMYIM